MKVENGKIKECTDEELFDFYLKRGWDDVYPYSTFKNDCIKLGTVILEEDSAHRMFEAMGYEKAIDTEDILTYLLKGFNTICFDKTTHRVGISGNRTEFNMNELKAVNEMIKELKW